MGDSAAVRHSEENIRRRCIQCSHPFHLFLFLLESLLLSLLFRHHLLVFGILQLSLQPVLPDLLLKLRLIPTQQNANKISYRRTNLFFLSAIHNSHKWTIQYNRCSLQPDQTFSLLRVLCFFSRQNPSFLDLRLLGESSGGSSSPRVVRFLSVALPLFPPRPSRCEPPRSGVEL